jgi:hypothetical protein
MKNWERHAERSPGISLTLLTSLHSVLIARYLAHLVALGIDYYCTRDASVALGMTFPIPHSSFLIKKWLSVPLLLCLRFAAIVGWAVGYW